MKYKIERVTIMTTIPTPNLISQFNQSSGCLTNCTQIIDIPNTINSLLKIKGLEK